jgi:hypothetical protein
VEGCFGEAVFAVEGPSPEDIAALAREAGLRVLESLPEPRQLELAIAFPAGFGELVAIATKVGGSRPDAPTPAGILAKWLAGSHVAATERREGGERVFAIARRDLGKKVAFEARAARDRIRLSAGPKASIEGLLAPLGQPLAGLVEMEVLSWSD